MTASLILEWMLYLGTRMAFGKAHSYKYRTVSAGTTRNVPSRDKTGTIQVLHLYRRNFGSYRNSLFWGAYRPNFFETRYENSHIMGPHYTVKASQYPKNLTHKLLRAQLSVKGILALPMHFIDFFRPSSLFEGDVGLLFPRPVAFNNLPFIHALPLSPPPFVNVGHKMPIPLLPYCAPLYVYMSF